MNKLELNEKSNELRVLVNNWIEHLDKTTTIKNLRGEILKKFVVEWAGESDPATLCDSMEFINNQVRNNVIIKTINSFQDGDDWIGFIDTLKYMTIDKFIKTLEINVKNFLESDIQF